MALQSKSKLFFAAIFALSTVACSGPKHSKEVLCEVKGDGSSLQFVRYLQSSYPRIGRVAGGESRYEGIYFDAGAKFWKSRWIMEGIDFSWDKNYVEDACRKGSKMDDSLIVLFPVQRQFHSSAVMSPRNRAIISDDGGSTFNLLYFPVAGYPYLVDRDERLLTRFIWQTSGVSLRDKGRIDIYQENVLLNVFLDGRLDATRNPWPDEGCEQCGPLLFRTLVSLDRGRSWKVSEYGFIKGSMIPNGAVLPLRTYENKYYFKEMEKKDGRFVECPSSALSTQDQKDRGCVLEGRTVLLE